MKVNNKAIIDDFVAYTEKISLYITLVFVVGLLLAGLLGLFLWSFKRLMDRQGSYEDILLTIQFENLAELAVFHKYYEKYYSHQ